jgi:hypothetical protein
VQVKAIAVQVVGKVLDLVMPNNKPMRFCTGAEMAKFGGIYGQIAEKVGNANLVGMVLTEAEVKPLLGGF